MLKDNTEHKGQIRSRVPALNRCMDILRFVKEHNNCVAADIVSNLDVPRSSIYVLLDEMKNLGLIRIDGKGQIQLWMSLIELGDAARRKLDLRDLITPHLHTLLDSVDCLAVHYGIMDGLKGFYAIKLESSRYGMSIKSHEGLEISLVHAGLGKCLLAFQDERVREKIIANLDYTKATKTSIGSADELRTELETIRLKGWAFDNSEGEESIRCVAAPVFYNNKLIGAISIVGMVNKYTDDVIPDIVTHTLKCASDIAADMACR